MSEDDPTSRMRRAIRQVRREGYKVAVIYAVVDAAAVALLVNVLVQVLPVPYVPERVGLPDAVVPAADLVGISLTDPAVTGAAVLALPAGLLTAALEVGLRARRPLVEQFEAANPEVREALRTARDAVEDGLQNRIALSLYDDVLTRLHDTSSVGLVRRRRVAATVLLVLVLSLVSLQVAVYDLSLANLGSDADEPGGVAPTEYTGLRDGDAILGDPTDVEAGEEELEATIGTSGQGGGNASDVPRSYETGGFAVAGDVESQQAGFSGPEQLEDAALIREYNLRIREDSDE
jgi:hypothetical protein